MTRPRLCGTCGHRDREHRYGRECLHSDQLTVLLSVMADCDCERFVEAGRGEASLPDLRPLQPIERIEFDTATLMAQHPPVWRDPNKRVVFDVAYQPGDVLHRQLGYSRWSAMALPNDVDPVAAAGLVSPRDGYFDYELASGRDEAVEWHVNFADPHLFTAYGSSLFAQDEMQVAEHPALGALKEALVAGGHVALTAGSDGPTPILVKGVERRCRIATDTDEDEGRPWGLYGNAFARASAEAVARATTRIEPPTITNLIAIAAPYPGQGRYQLDQIHGALVTAFTGFRAAVEESERQVGGRASVVVHTGYWGCGAFGGNRVLMTMLQALAAQMAGLEQLVFHTGTAGGGAPLDRALHLLREDIASAAPVATNEVIARIDDMAFQWGVSDGN